MNVALAALLIAIVFVSALIDCRTRRIPNAVTYAGLLMLLLVAASTGLFSAALIGTFAVGGALGALYVVTAGRGIGLGDVKLGACIGAGLGVYLGLIAVGAAFVIGAAAALVLLGARKAKRGDAIAFGPFLAAGSIASLTASLWVYP